MTRNLAILLICFLATCKAYCQINPADVNPFFYEADTVPRIDVFIDPDSLSILLDDQNSDHEYLATFVYNNFSGICDTFENVGFRLRGNVSRISDRKSYKISLNTYEPGRKYYGLEKINLKRTGDDSFIRPKLSWYLCRQMGIPSIWLSHIQLYVNNEAWGLYSNVEHIDEEFVKKWFGNNNGNLYKCRYPSDLNWLGDNQEDYKYTNFYFGERELRVYELKTNTNKDDYSDLVEFTNVLNNTPSDDFKTLISRKVNISNLLKFFALEVYLGHWDSYSQGGNNYFLYNNQASNKFEYITYDMDLTLGIEFGMEDITDRNIYQYERESERNVLRSKIISVPEFRDIYSYYLKQLVTKYPPDTIRTKAELIQELIAPIVEQDPFYPNGLDQFYEALDTPIGFARYGIIEYLDLRNTSILEQLEEVNIPPIISNVHYKDCSVNDTIRISCTIEDEDTIHTPKIVFSFNESADSIREMELISQGPQPGTYHYQIILEPTKKSGLLNFYIEAKDSSNQISRSPYPDYHSIHAYSGYSNLRINEILTSNDDCMTDEYGEHEDWIEVINLDTQAISLKNKYLSDSYENPNEWQLPAILLQPGEIAWFWADDEPFQGDNHAEFRLARGGETVYLFEQQGDIYVLLDSLEYAEQNQDETYGILPYDTSSVGVLPQITPGIKNDSTGLAYLTFDVDMNYYIEEKKFNPRRDEVDVIGNFNDWKGSQTFMDSNSDSSYTHTIYNLTGGSNIEYRFRVNQGNYLVEFADLPGPEGNRFYTLKEGCNSVRHLFNDEIPTDIETIEIPGLAMFPNPVKEVLYINSAEALSRIEVIDVYGKILKQVDINGEFELVVDMQSIAQGIYLITVNTENGLTQTQKILKR